MYLVLAGMVVNFNPHSREGSDFTELETIDGIFTFQSTLPRRE